MTFKHGFPLMQSLRPLARAALFSLLIATLSCAQAGLHSDLPDLGAPDLVSYTPEKEQALGRAFSTTLHTQFDMIQDPTLLDYVRQIGARITSQTQSQRDYRFYVIDRSDINAFAGPNGIIGLHSGLILAARSEDELASVIAHEIAHVTQRHLSRRYEYQNNNTATTIASLIAAILVGSQNPSAGMATMMGATGLNLQQQLKNSRLHENEADHFGIRYLTEAGYNPFAMGDFFGRLARESQYDEFALPEILRTHPVSADRLARADDRAGQMPTDSQKRASQKDTLTLMQLRLQNRHPEDINAFEQAKLSSAQSCYRKNHQAWLKQQDTAVAYSLKCLDQAEQDAAASPYYALLKAQIQTRLKRRDALKTLDYLTEIYPRNAAMVLARARALQAFEGPQAAIAYLEQNVDRFLHKAEFYNRLSQLHTEQEDDFYSDYYQALLQEHLGNIEKARYLSRQAEAHVTAEMRKKNARIEQLKSRLTQYR
ncbi:M48 family metalloprotease [Hydrogenovibrio halophilus]|uniref:M48 family metalloprotease n=1 Tax=Hydrogenovibrio halophilus TaxID=373391 RepID=UPI000A061529|nr:M48 family metalloprotease [Hydrogenovibrio halophilus]